MHMQQATGRKNSSFSQVVNVLDKYGLQYYLCILNYLVIWCIYLKTNQPAYLAAYYFTFIYSGKLLPNDDLPVNDSVKQNKNTLLQIPLVLQSICIWVTIIGIFITFPFFKYTLQQTTIMSILLMVIIAVSIGNAHELMHRPEKIFKAMAKLQVSIPLFTVYPFSHIHFHHKYVGTETDFITSPKNRNTYLYALQVFPKAYSCVYKNNKAQFFNCIAVILGYLITLFCIALQQGCTFKIAMLKVGYMILIGLGGYYLFEFVEATQHYGLLYRKNAQQKEVLQICAWNSEENIILNWIGFRFQRHSDHHMNAYKIYTTTELTKQMPKIPFSVFEAFLFSTIPPLWYIIMNPYVQNVMQGKPVQASHSKFVERAKISAMTISLTIVWYFAFSAFRTSQNHF